jgi:ubiquinone/menaquinone biosynthesis C-methylase UbiE
LRIVYPKGIAEKIMASTLNISEKIKDRIRSTYGTFVCCIGNISPEKSTSDVLSTDKVKEQVALIEKKSGQSIKGRKILEIGSGFGVFVAETTLNYGADTYGVEPDGPGFSDSFALSRELLRDNGINEDRIKKGYGEDIPFPENTFDFIFSSNVLEHVNDPAKVLSEAIRVTKPGGFIQIVVPNYGSFYDGHYACMYIPYQPMWFWKFWIKYVLHKDPTFAGTIRTEVNYFSVKRMLKPFTSKKEIEIVSMGEDTCRERMTTLAFTPYAGLTKIKRIIELLHKTKLIHLATWFVLLIKAHSPLIISIRKC